MHTSLRIFKNQQFWEISFYIPTEHIVDELDGYDLYCVIRIDAESGVCLGIGTPLK